jgi:hypothetical protein
LEEEEVGGVNKRRTSVPIENKRKVKKRSR